ncbi:unnamed protein product [Paramecium pentaurelia]|uniref:Uncharacterized protein n=1 Tax=Paramecium pentaurelia TaxID=43138 RepID=A0A8S1YD62_9CILI|nr:unnamed protein product [Paramecium pentaurelia]
MNILLSCIQGQKEFNQKQQLQSDINKYILYPETLTPILIQICVKIFANKDKYLDAQEESLILQLIIKGLVIKKYNHDILIEIGSVINLQSNDKAHQNIFYYVYLSSLYKQKSKSVQQQQQLNKMINLYEDQFKNYIHHLSQIEWNHNLLQSLIKCVLLNPTLFRNHQKQIQELCIQRRSQTQIATQLAQLYAVLQFTYLEGKQGNNSYQSQIVNTLEQIFDAYYIVSTLIDLEKEKLVLQNNWQTNLSTEEIKMNLLNIEGKNQKTKYSIIFQIIKEFLISNDNFSINFKETLNFLSLLLQQQLQFIKEDILIDIQIESAIQKIGEILQLNNSFNDHLDVVYETQLNQSIMQQLQNKLNKLMIDRGITLSIESFKELNYFSKSISLSLLHTLILSSFSKGLIMNTSILQILFKFTQSSFSVNTSIIKQLSQVCESMSQQKFLTTRIELEVISRILEQLELEFPKYMKNMSNYMKRERHQIYQPVDNKKKQKVIKDIQLGFLPQDQLNKTSLKILKQRFENQFISLSKLVVNNLRQGNSLDLTKRLYQLLFIIFSFPHDILLNYCGIEVISSLLRLCKVVLQNYNELELCLIQPIKYFILFLLQSDVYEIDLDLQEATSGIMELINFVYQRRKTLSIDNYVSTIKSINDQFSKAQQIFQSVNSEEQYYSCKDNQMDQSMNASNGNTNNNNLQQIAAQIRKTKSFIGEEESSSKQQKQTEDEMFYSIVNHSNTDNAKGEQQNQQIVTLQQNVIVNEDEEIEIPKVVFD